MILEIFSSRNMLAWRPFGQEGGFEAAGWYTSENDTP